MVRAPERYFVWIGLLLVVAGLAVRSLGTHWGGADFVVGLLMGAGVTLELVGVVQMKRRSGAETKA